MHRSNSAKPPLLLLRNPKDLNCHGEWFIQNSTSSRMRHKSLPALVEFFHSLPPDKGSPSPPFFFSPLSSFSFSFFFLSISPSAPHLCWNYTVHAISPEIPSWAGIDARQRHEKNIDARVESLADPCRPRARSFFYFFSFFFSPPLLLFADICRDARWGRIELKVGADRMQINTCAQYN